MATKGRPRLPDDQITYKRPPEGYKRKSNHTGVQLDIPEPSDKEKAKWAKLARLCWERVVTNPSPHVATKKNMIEIVWPSKADIPEDFPRGRYSKKEVANGIVKRYNAEAVLMWLWERKLTKHSVSELYNMRKEAWMGAVSGLNMEISVWGEYNVEKLLDEFS